jgi:hypothetical protein
VDVHASISERAISNRHKGSEEKKGRKEGKKRRKGEMLKRREVDTLTCRGGCECSLCS